MSHVHVPSNKGDPLLVGFWDGSGVKCEMPNIYEGKVIGIISGPPKRVNPVVDRVKNLLCCRKGEAMGHKHLLLLYFPLNNSFLKFL
jgi:hypothetical protein